MTFSEFFFFLICSASIFDLIQTQTSHVLLAFLSIQVTMKLRTVRVFFFSFWVSFLAVTARALNIFVAVSSVGFGCAPVSITEFSRAFKKYITWNEYK